MDQITPFPCPLGAWWSGTLAELDATGDTTITERLSARAIATHALNHKTQKLSWDASIPLLRHALAALPRHWRLLLEYPLLRLGRRIDAVLLTERAVIVLELKVGAEAATNAGRIQVEDYALDLLDFHAASRAHPIVPVLVATESRPAAPQWPLIWHGVTPVLDASATRLAPLLDGIATRLPEPATPLAIDLWEAAPYRPVPTIIEAATLLYRRHGVQDIAAARADLDNLTRTTATLLAAIAEAERDGAHIILFVTGIPGAGKTLCGLNAVFGAPTGAAFLTGNLPLVHVLREALARDAAAQHRSKRQAAQQAESAIQPLTGFVRDNVARTTPPHEHVIVFDEAQRAWDAAYGRRKFNLPTSEAALFLDIMRRHNDHAVVVALVGGGQEINTGEAGLAEWGRALATRADWRIRAAPCVLKTDDPRQRLFANPPPTLTLDPALHLRVPVRQIRSAAAAPWVEAVLRGDASAAAAIATEAGAIPFRLTRSLAAMRATLRAEARGQRRAGLVCSTGARRLRADGIWPDFPHLDSDAVSQWFLNRWPDVRASDALEAPATQFACQGLELDLVGLCWGGDLIHTGAWAARSFAGTTWRTARNETTIAYRLNTYRVLLTRARYETILWIPEGSTEDETRHPAALDATADFLMKCGARPLLPVPTQAAPTEQTLL